MFLMKQFNKLLKYRRLPCPACGLDGNCGIRRRDCNRYHAAKRREWNQRNPLKGEARRRDIVRSIAGVYKRRGKLVPLPCEVCGSTEVEMHHPNYARPLDVVWLCKKHHQSETNLSRSSSAG
jgi:hypothetical protein